MTKRRAFSAITSWPQTVQPETRVVLLKHFVLTGLPPPARSRQRAAGGIEGVSLPDSEHHRWRPPTRLAMKRSIPFALNRRSPSETRTVKGKRLALR